MISSRPPIVVILGHVDHGKTTILDYLRKSNVAAREAGGITQTIRSFQLTSGVSHPITFIDTPGHAAFSQMRSRGSRIADIAILVVASNDGVMPQTKESIEFIKKAGIPIIVALNKSDLPTADPNKVKSQLSENGVLVEDYGGDTPSVSVSGKTGNGIPELLEIVDLLSRLNPPQADPDSILEAVVLESRLDPQKGSTAVCIVRNGTLSVGQTIFQESEIGKVRGLIDPDGKPLKTAPPSTPVEIIGLSSIPAIGSTISTTPISPRAPVLSSSNLITNETSLINLVIKADVAGSLEAILASLPPQVTVLSSGTGEVTDTDVALAQTSHAVILAFNCKVSSLVSKLAQTEKVSIRQFKIIYELLDTVNRLISPQTEEIILGKAQVLAEFKMNGDRIAGCRCLEGVMSRSDQVKVVRNEQTLGVSKIKSLHQAKLSIEKVKSGLEFGAILSPYIEFKVGDSIIAFQIHGTS